jgi:hypothetical protein
MTDKTIAELNKTPGNKKIIWKAPAELWFELADGTVVRVKCENCGSTIGIWILEGSLLVCRKCGDKFVLTSGPMAKQD